MCELGTTRRNYSAMHTDSRKVDQDVAITMAYAAPELLDDTSKPSRKTDMFAFAVLAWEVLTDGDIIPYIHIRAEDRRHKILNENERPSLDLMVKETPMGIRNMIECTWSKDRSVRKTSGQALSIIRKCYDDEIGI